ncbi:MAG: hypothetical protein K2M31_03470 [Muribaculaceae bacterium]|nr:hypothetical protein [Muribaculaceae bacterium]
MNTRLFTILISLFFAAGSIFAQNSAPRPGGGGGGNFGGGPGGGFGGFGGTSAPAPGSGGAYTPNIGPVGPSPGWGGPWGPGYSSSPAVIVNINPFSPGWSDSGTTSVVGVGYDAQGIWRTIPMTVAYNYVGGQYNVTVLNAWNPWTDFWNRGIDQPAYNTSYYLRGNNYNYYTVLSTGTYYFNL